MTELHFSDLNALGERQKNRVQQLFEEAFPLSEREPFVQIAEAVHRGDMLAVVATVHTDPVGFVFASRLESIGMTFIEYMAIDPDRQARGYGSALWRGLEEMLAERGYTGSVVLEVEDPDDPQITVAERLIRTRRVRFYERLGAVLVALSREYRVPRFGSAGTLTMRLMYADAGTPGIAPTFEEAEKIVDAVYRESYHLPADHPLIRDRI